MFLGNNNNIVSSDFKAEYNKQCEEVKQLKSKIFQNQILISTLKEKLHRTHSVIYSIETDKEGNETFICVHDQRRVEWNCEKNRFFKKGDLNIFVLSNVIASTGVSGRITDMPYLLSTFSEKHVTIDELHCDIINGLYEDKGYATMMINSLVQIAKCSQCSSIGGKLFKGDADTPRKKRKEKWFL